MIVVAWVVGIGSFAHVIAGSSDTLFVVFRGERTLGEYLVNFLLPSLIGNSVGGVALVAALAHAQHAPNRRKQPRFVPGCRRPMIGA